MLRKGYVYTRRDKDLKIYVIRCRKISERATLQRKITRQTDSLYGRMSSISQKDNLLQNVTGIGKQQHNLNCRSVRTYTQYTQYKNTLKSQDNYHRETWPWRNGPANN
ncbi:hypothetical protein GQX74_003137 [Glossina fuscipes]|nr:hypothetical protein GQX74_003137 [Glossina fuscipes]